MGRRGRPPYPDILTPREWEVLALLREGLTNEAIAARLGISHAAAKYHVSEILSKLGVASREEAAAWQPEAERRRWWAAFAWLRPATVGKAAVVVAAVAVLAGLGVLAWVVSKSNSTSEDPGPPTSAAASEQLTYIGPGGEMRIVDSDGTDDRLFAASPCPAAKASPSTMAWSPDGAALAYVCPLEEARTDLVVYGADGAELTRVTDVARFAWSPDGARLAYQGYTRRYTVGLLNIASGDTEILQEEAILMDWAGPDSLLLGLELRPGEFFTEFEAHIMDLESRGTTPLPALDNDLMIWVSPDGSKAIVLRPEEAPVGPGVAMALYDFEKGMLTPIPGGYIGYPSEFVPHEQLAFSHDSTAVYWANAAEGPVTVWMSPLDDPEARLLGEAPGLFVAVSPAGRVAVLRVPEEGTTARVVIDDFTSGQTVDIGPGGIPFAWRSAAPSPVNPSRDQLSFLIDGKLYIVNSDGSGKTQLGRDGVCPKFSALSWSPDGARLVCSGGAATVLLDADGNSIESWTEPGAGGVQWSPDSVAFALQVGDRLAIRSRDGEALADLGPADLRPGGISIDGRANLWSPDGKEIAYWNSASAELRIYSPESGAERAVAVDYRPLLWLDGDTILAAAGYKPPPAMRVTIYDIVLLDTATGDASPIPELRASLDGPIRPDLQLWFSSDASRAAVLIGRSGEVPGLGVFDMQTRTLTTIPQAVISYPGEYIPQNNVRWSADGRTLYWIDAGFRSSLYGAPVDGNPLTRLMDLPFGGILSPDLRSVAYIKVAPDLSGTLYISETDGTNPRPIDSRPSGEGASPAYTFAWRPAP